MPPMDTTDFLGTGWAFPPSFSTGGGAVQMVANEEDIHQSLMILFATRPGERAMQELYGCSLADWQFSEIDHGLVSQLTSAIHDAVLFHEPRVTLLDVDVNPDPAAAGVLLIQLSYSVTATNTRFNMVFPFYRNEASPGAI